MIPTSYVIYNSPGSRNALNQNQVSFSEASEYPRRLYSKQALNPSKCHPYKDACQDYRRDKDMDYVYRAEKDYHPDHFSRFSYGLCPNGYCTAAWPGRYNTPPSLIQFTNEQPPDMAPEEFYHGKYVSPFYCDSEAYIDARFARDTRGFDV